PVQLVHPIVIISIPGGPRNMTSSVVVLEVTMDQPVKCLPPGSTLKKKKQKKPVGAGVELTRNWDQWSQSIP
ncbi:hypothetical protein TNCT_583871, partial [Trichonephila clavata]